MYRSARGAVLSRPKAGKNFADLHNFEVGLAALTAPVGRQIKIRLRQKTLFDFSFNHSSNKNNASMIIKFRKTTFPLVNYETSWLIIWILSKRFIIGNIVPFIKHLVWLFCLCNHSALREWCKQFSRLMEIFLILQNVRWRFKNLYWIRAQPHFLDWPAKSIILQAPRAWADLF